MSASDSASGSSSPAGAVNLEAEVDCLRQKLQEATTLLDERDRTVEQLRQEADSAKRQVEMQEKEQEVVTFMTAMGDGGNQQQAAAPPLQDGAVNPAVLHTINQWQQNGPSRRGSPRGYQPRQRSSPHPQQQQHGAVPMQFGVPPQVSHATSYQQFSAHTQPWHVAPAPYPAPHATPHVRCEGFPPMGDHLSTTSRRQKNDIPLPRQMTYDGTATWQSFILPFNSLAEACQWSEGEKLFRLTNSLRSEAAEYAFEQLPANVVSDFEKLVAALDSRFAEKRTTASYLAQLEARKMQTKEKVAEYIADIKRLVIKGYPTADSGTRETIGLRYFLKGLPDSQTAVAVGMKNPQTLEEARTALDTYTSLKEETKSPRVRAVQPQDRGNKSKGDNYVTENRLQEFGAELKSGFNSQFGELKAILLEKSKPEKSKAKAAKREPAPRSRSPSPKPKKRVSFEEIECFRCHKMGHFANKCPEKDDISGSEAGSDTEGTDSEN